MGNYYNKYYLLRSMSTISVEQFGQNIAKMPCTTEISRIGIHLSDLIEIIAYKHD